MINIRAVKKPVPSNIPEPQTEDEKWLLMFNGKGFYLKFGAVAAAKDLLVDWWGFREKAVRLIKYEGKKQISEVKEMSHQRICAIGFRLIQFVKGLLPEVRL
jgi:hypothetical protein